ncbi:MOSC domain-containing protein YiiM [Conyzicola lurida]|uniref:MOSC domain-containing protein YiiM n=1 Tax=Conyzicola lurida TaxID=1172621 RepID=A0A841ANS1_9MICO|nr:MOSC domain-containing protein [Conyzicola lurida]MBB5843069.1 MOSC domain-containing protein YiiM [Conyzicola lurida]
MSSSASQPGSVVAVSRSASHSFSKPAAEAITLIENWGVEGDAHAGVTAQHLYVVKKDPTRANLTQVHLIQEELFAELADRFTVGPGELGENVTTRGVDLLTLPLGTRLHLGTTAVVEVTGLRSPCSQINAYQGGLMKALVAKDDDGCVIRKSGIMGIVVAGGVVAPGDGLRVELPAGEHIALGVV